MRSQRIAASAFSIIDRVALLASGDPYVVDQQGHGTPKGRGEVVESLADDLVLLARLTDE